VGGVSAWSRTGGGVKPIRTTGSCSLQTESVANMVSDFVCSLLS
jgi:hypothetical protein